MKDLSPLLFFSCFSWLCTHGKVNSLLGRSSCLATEKTLLFHLFKCSHIPVSTRIHVDRADRAEATHITLSLVLTSIFFIILHLVVNTPLSSSKDRNSSLLFLYSYQEFLSSFLRCLWDGSADWTKAGGQRAHIFICETNRPGVPGGYGNPESFLSRDQPRHTPSSSAEAGRDVCQYFKGLAKAGTLAKLSRRAITAQ